MSKTFYVSNRGQAIDLNELETLFTSVGDVESLRLEVHPESIQGYGFGVAEMATEQQAADCILRFNGQTVSGHTLSVTATKPAPSFSHLAAPKSSRKSSVSQARKSR